MGTFKNRWNKLRQGKEFRDEFIAAQAKQAIPYQIRALLKQRKLKQEELAELAGLTQGVISRAANPTYGNLSVNTCVKIAAGFDVAFVGRFVPFSELDRWLDHLHEESSIPTFQEENEYAEALFTMFDESEDSISLEASKKLADGLTEISGEHNKYQRASRQDQLALSFDVPPSAQACPIPTDTTTRQSNDEVGYGYRFFSDPQKQRDAATAA